MKEDLKCKAIALPLFLVVLYWVQQGPTILPYLPLAVQFGPSHWLNCASPSLCSGIIENAGHSRCAFCATSLHVPVPEQLRPSWLNLSTTQRWPYHSPMQTLPSPCLALKAQCRAYSLCPTSSRSLSLTKLWNSLLPTNRRVCTSVSVTLQH